MNLNKLVQASIFTALAIGAGFALLMIPNIELISVIVFLAGMHLGISWGVVIGGTAEMVFSGLNPMGSGLTFPPLFISQILGMVFIGFSGGFLGHFFFKKTISTFQCILLGLTGFLLTFIFDSLTTLSYPISAGFDLSRTIGLYISGIGFTLLHQVSNAVVFAVGVPSVTKYLVKSD
ncbi:MAG: hypothetical protein ACE5D0_04445 [Fidelibacterota bacterium]